jgi:hypothetical protein
MLRIKNTYYWSLQRNKQGLRSHLLSSHNPIIYNTLRISKRWLLGVQLAAVVKHKGSHTSYSSGEWTVERGFPFHIQLSQRQPHRHRDHIMTCFIHKKFAQAKPLALFLYYHNNKSPPIIFEPRHTTIRSGGLNSFNFEDNKSASYRTTDQLISIVGEPQILTRTSTTHQYQHQQPPRGRVHFLGAKDQSGMEH